MLLLKHSNSYKDFQIFLIQAKADATSSQLLGSFAFLDETAGFSFIHFHDALPPYFSAPTISTPVFCQNVFTLPYLHA